MTWPEAMVAIAAMICALNLVKSMMRFIDGRLR